MPIERAMNEHLKDKLDPSRRVREQYDAAVKERQIVEKAHLYAQNSIPMNDQQGLVDELTLHYGRLYVKLLGADLAWRRQLEQSAWHIYCEHEGWDPNEDHGDEMSELRKAALSNGRP